MLKLILYFYAVSFIAAQPPAPDLPDPAHADIYFTPLPAEAPQLEPVVGDILHADTFLPETPAYQADSDPQTLYFDAQGLPAEAAAAGGYYRKVLGKSGDGRLVVQDFYQDNDQAQTGVSLLVKDADPADFSFDPVDSKTVWYRADGSVKAIADLESGDIIGYFNYYQDNKLMLQYSLNGLMPAEVPDWGYIGSALFYPDGRYMTVYVSNHDDHTVSIHFRADGSPILATNLDAFDPGNPQEGTYRAWQADGSPMPLADAQKEAEPIEAAAAERWMQYEQDF